jgi:hypothetical protein
VDGDALRELYFGTDGKSGLSIRAIGRLKGIHRATVRYHVMKDPRFRDESGRRAKEGIPGAGGRSGGRYGTSKRREAVA